MYVDHKLGFVGLYKRYFNEDGKAKGYSEIPFGRFLVDIYYTKFNPILKKLNIFDKIKSIVKTPIQSYSNKKFNDYIKLNDKQVMSTPISSLIGIGVKKLE